MIELEHNAPRSRGYVGLANAREHTGGAYGLHQVHLPHDWQADDRSDRRRVWGVILACAVGVVSLLLLLDANRAALYGVGHSQAVEVSDVNR